jgi:hypothetical protein
MDASLKVKIGAALSGLFIMAAAGYSLADASGLFLAIGLWLTLLGV